MVQAMGVPHLIHGLSVALCVALRDVSYGNTVNVLPTVFVEYYMNKRSINEMRINAVGCCPRRILCQVFLSFITSFHTFVIIVTVYICC